MCMDEFVVARTFKIVRQGNFSIFLGQNLHCLANQLYTVRYVSTARPVIPMSVECPHSLRQSILYLLSVYAANFARNFEQSLQASS